MAALPFRFDEAVTLRELFADVSESGTPRLGVAYGTRDRDGMAVAAVLHEIPRAARGAMSKPDAEISDVARWLEHDGVDATLGEGANPPDVQIELNGRRIGVEAAQLCLPGPTGNSVAVGARFDAVVDSLVALPHRTRRRMSQHQGRLAVLFVVDPTKALRSVTQSFQDLLISAHPRDFDLTALPSTAPQGVCVMSKDQSVGITWLPPSANPSESAGFDKLGFELGLGYCRVVSEEEVRRELVRLVDQHDSPANDALLITIGRPTRHGRAFPSAAVVSRLLMDVPDLANDLRPGHLANVALMDDTGAEPVVRWILGESPFSAER